jgi:hypothetical protein
VRKDSKGRSIVVKACVDLIVPAEKLLNEVREILQYDLRSFGSKVLLDIQFFPFENLKIILTNRNGCVNRIEMF